MTSPTWTEIGLPVAAAPEPWIFCSLTTVRLGLRTVAETLSLSDTTSGPRLSCISTEASLVKSAPVTV
jgi:hypothetical protein